MSYKTQLFDDIIITSLVVSEAHRKERAWYIQRSYKSP